MCFICYVVVVIIIYFTDMFYLIQWRNTHGFIGTQANKGLQVTLIQVITGITHRISHSTGANMRMDTPGLCSFLWFC